MSRRIYDIVKQTLIEHPQTRNDDKSLTFTVWNRLGFIHNRAITYDDYRKAPSTETIRRTRQKLQETIPELIPTDLKTIQIRKKKQLTKGTFIYREVVS